MSATTNREKIRDIAYKAIHAAPDGRTGYVELIAEILTIAAWEDGHDIDRLAADALELVMDGESNR